MVGWYDSVGMPKSYILRLGGLIWEDEASERLFVFSTGPISPTTQRILIVPTLRNRATSYWRIITHDQEYSDD